MRMVREWRHLKMLKRAGWVHTSDGIEGTKPGELALLCPACPQPDYNLPYGWERAEPQKRCSGFFSPLICAAIHATICVVGFMRYSSELMQTSASRGRRYLVRNVIPVLV